MIQKVLLIIFKIKCFANGIIKGKQFILYQSGYRNKDGNGIVCWAEIEHITRDFISIKLYNHDVKFASEIGQTDIYIDKEYYNWGAYSYLQVKAMIKAQDHLKQQFTMLIKPF